MKKAIYIGTSGWSYTHWKENFYPRGLKPTEWLNHYSSVFLTVEVNSTFYHTPLKTTLQNWNTQVPEDFIFSIKANRYITHQKKLHDCKESLQFFYKNLEALKAKVGPILFQLPPYFKMDMDRLKEFTDLLNDKHEHVFEFRHHSWFNSRIYDFLSKRRIALCLTDLNGAMSPEEITSHFTYIRLHGPKKAYQGTYSPTELKLWQKKIINWSKKISVYCYFDNDEKGYAVQDAMTLKSRC